MAENNFTENTEACDDFRGVVSEIDVNFSSAYEKAKNFDIKGYEM